MNRETIQSSGTERQVSREAHNRDNEREWVAGINGDAAAEKKAILTADLSAINAQIASLQAKMDAGATLGANLAKNPKLMELHISLGRETQTALSELEAHKAKMLRELDALSPQGTGTEQ